MNASARRAQAGLTLVEVLLAVAIGGLLLAALHGVAGQALSAETEARERNDLERDARLAMGRMVAAVSGSPRLLLPLADRPSTTRVESVREPGVLALTLDPTIDRDRDGIADADNDGDGRIDEDLSADASNDGAPGIAGMDDDGDGVIDKGVVSDNDENGSADVDAVSGIDDDGDGRVDEDWLDPVVYHLVGTDLLERIPDPGASSGRDWTERVVAANVSRFRVERLQPAGHGLPTLVDISLELRGAGGREVSLHTRVRLGDGR